MKNKYFITRTFAIIFFISIANTVYGQDSVWTVYNTSNSGLPHNNVHGIAIDGNGNKWILTLGGGLAKYDGTNWNIYNTSNSGLPNNYTHAIAIDGTGNKWIGTPCCGLGKYDGTNWTVYNISNSGLPDNNVYVIVTDGNGNKWIGTRGGGIAKYDGSTWTVYNTSNSGLPGNWIDAIAIESNGNMWIGTTFNGLAKFDGTNWTVYDIYNSGLPSNWVEAIAIDSNGNKWIGTYGAGIAKYDGTNWSVYSTSNSGLPDNAVMSIVIDINGNKWIGTYGGIAKYDGTNWTVYNGWNSGLPPNFVMSIAIESNGNKWIGTEGGGIAKFSDQIALINPTGGEVLQTLSQHNITWISHTIDNIKIEYSTNNGTSWTNIVSSITASTGSYSWTVPYPLSNQCKVRLRDMNDSLISSVSNATFSITSPLNITSPTGGQNWQALSQQNITWASGNIENIKIEYSTNNGTSWNLVVSSTPAGTGSYSWTIPNTPSAQCKVRLSDVNYDSYFSSSGSFIISPALTLTSPTGGQNWQVLSQKNITWTSINVIQNIKIEYTTNNGTNWNEIISSTPASSGSFSWVIPNTPSAQCKIRLTNLADSTIFSQSSGTFTISAYPISAKITADSVWLDTNFDGGETKQVNANLSNGLKLNYEWYVKNILIAQGINPTITFSTGDTWLKLKVTDSLNQIAYDSVKIKVYCSKSKTNGGIYSGVSQIGNQFYVTSLDKGVYRFDSSGVLPLPYLTGGSIQSTMAISNKNLLYVGSDDTRLYCFDVTLSSIWDKSTGGVIKASPSVTTDGNTIYIGTNNGYLKALDANNGNSKWTFIANGGIISSPTLVEVVDSNQNVIEKIIYFGTDLGMFYAIKDKETTFENYWSLNTSPDSAIISSPAISNDGMIYFGSKNGNLYRVKWDGTYQPSWQKNTGGKIASSPVIGKNDVVYVANSNGYLYGYEKEFTSGSSPLKQFNIQSGVNGTPSIGADGNLYLGFNNGKFYKLEDMEGVTNLEARWYLSANGGIESPVLVKENGVIVVGCTNGDVYIMKDPVTTTEATANLNLSWPTFKGNNKRNKVTQISTSTTGLSDISEIPSSFNLSQNYPNPFNPSTVINYQLPVNSYVTLKVFDVIGNEVATLVNQEKPAGSYEVTFDASNLTSGVYFYELHAGDFRSIKKLMLVK